MNADEVVLASVYFKQNDALGPEERLDVDAVVAELQTPRTYRRGNSPTPMRLSPALPASCAAETSSPFSPTAASAESTKSCRRGCASGRAEAENDSDLKSFDSSTPEPCGKIGSAHNDASRIYVHAAVFEFL